MTRRERLLLITFFALVLVGLGSSEPASTVLGGIGGAAVGVAAHRRLQRTSRRMDERLGADQPARKGFSWRRPL
ncbi:MAG: hypothetical protein JWN08_3524, partial [Frankiales bacterium]|nr:hypothetical protein [Frankiales bacterium]